MNIRFHRTRTLLTFAFFSTTVRASAQVVATLSTSPPVPLDTIGCDRQLTAEQMGAARCVAAIEQIAMSDTGSMGMHPVINGHATLQHDSVVIIVDSLARTWLTALQRHQTIAPRDLLNQVALQVQLGQDAEARHSIEQWLASPGITTHDTLAALAAGVVFFTTTFEGPPSPARFTIAQSYIARLEAMPIAVAARSLHDVRMAMMLAYARAGATDSAIANGLRGFAVIQQIPTYEERSSVATSNKIIDLARLLVAQPGGVARVDSLVAVLKSTIVPPPELVTKDTALKRRLVWLEEDMSRNTGVIHWFGRTLTPLIATHWFNQPTPVTPSPEASNARALPLDDGIIRILGFGWFTCGWCGAAMKQLQKDQALLPKGVQIEFYEWTLGYWGKDFATPEEEAGHLRQYWLDRKHFTFPIALWAGPKEGTPGEGALPRESPTHKALFIQAGPTFFVTDGHGVVRHWQAGYNGYQKDMASTINLLVSERDNARDHAR